jgi:hypothetical protein
MCRSQTQSKHHALVRRRELGYYWIGNVDKSEELYHSSLQLLGEQALEGLYSRVAVLFREREEGVSPVQRTSVLLSWSGVFETETRLAACESA